MARAESTRHRSVRELLETSRWWRGVGVLCAVLGAIGVGAGIPLSLVDGHQVIGVPMTAVGVVLLIGVWRSTENADGLLDQSFEHFDTSTKGRPQPIP